MMLKKAIEYKCDVDEVLSSCCVGKASLGVSSSSNAQLETDGERKTDEAEGGRGRSNEKGGHEEQ